MARPDPAAPPARRLVTKVAGTTLTEPFTVGGQEVLNQVGTCSFALAYDDPQNALCVTGAVVTQDLDGITVGEWLIAELEATTLDPEDDESQKVFRYTGSGYSPADAVVYPSQGIYEVPSGPLAGLRIATKPYSDDRYLGPMERYYDDSGWGAAVEALAPHGPFRPEGFPDYDASWIWDAALSGGAHPTGSKWFRTTFTPVSSVVFAVKIVLASLNGHEAYLDGTLVSKTDPAIDTDAGTKARGITVEINGDQPHTLAVRVDHTVAGGAGGLLFAVYEHETDTVLARSDSTCKVVDVTDEPGMTPGGVWAQLRSEAHDRGSLIGHTETFTDIYDSRGDRWPTIIGDFGVRVLDGYDDVIDQLAEGWWDWWYQAGSGPTLSAVVADGVTGPDGAGAGRGSVSGVEFAAGVNCTELVHTERDTVKSVGLARWGDGFVEGQIDEAVDGWGRREVGLALSSVQSGPSTLWTMLATLKPVSAPEVSIVITIAPEDADDCPFLAFGVGDRVTAPARDGTPTVYRVVAISWDEDETGDIAWQVELATARDVQEQVWHRWLRRTGNGTLDGRSRSATVTSPSVMNAGVVSVIEKQWGLSGEPIDGDRGDPWRPREQQLIYRLELECDTAGASGDTTLTLYSGITAVGSVTMANGDDSGFADLDTPLLVDPLDTLVPEVAAAGGHTNCTFTYLAFPTQ